MSNPLSRAILTRARGPYRQALRARPGRDSMGGLEERPFRYESGMAVLPYIWYTTLPHRTARGRVGATMKECRGEIMSGIRPYLVLGPRGWSSDVTG